MKRYFKEQVSYYTVRKHWKDTCWGRTRWWCWGGDIIKKILAQIAMESDVCVCH